jgi:hypothetical protein
VLVATLVVSTESLEALNMSGFSLFKTVRCLVSVSRFEYVLMNDTARWRFLDDLWSGWPTSSQGLVAVTRNPDSRD